MVLIGRPGGRKIRPAGPRLAAGRSAGPDIYAKNCNSLIIGVNHFLCWFFWHLSFFYRHIKIFFNQMKLFTNRLALFSLFRAILANIEPFDLPLELFLIYFLFFNWFWPFVEPISPFWEILDKFRAILTLKSIEKAQNRSGIARRAVKTVKNQEKWPKIGLEEPEGW